jgi:hypothetical protein
MTVFFMPSLLLGDRQGRPYYTLGDRQGRPYYTLGDRQGRPYSLTPYAFGRAAGPADAKTPGRRHLH